MLDIDTLNQVRERCGTLRSVVMLVVERLDALIEEIDGASEPAKPTELELEVMRMVTEGGPAEWSWPYSEDHSD
jgi:hypothetical protein